MTQPDLNPSTSLSEQIEDGPSYQDIDSEQPTAPNVAEQSELNTEGHFYMTPAWSVGFSSVISLMLYQVEVEHQCQQWLLDNSRVRYQVSFQQKSLI